MKTQPNPLCEVVDGSAAPVRPYALRDLGASIGSTRWFLPGSKSNVEDFEREQFIHSVRYSHVRFHYRRAWCEPHLKRGVTPADVCWISERLARLTATQWSDAFRAAGYTQTETERYVVRLRQKVEEGLGVEGGS